MTDIINKVAKEVGLPYKVVENVYKAYWKFVKTKIEELPLFDNLTEEEFAELKTSVNIPSIGKFYVTYEGINKQKKNYNDNQKN